jgi:uroporphyrinogen-III decarboxylase
MVVWLLVDGFFWFPRALFGIEQHLLAFHDQPDLMHRMNSDLLEHNLRVLEEVSAVCQMSFVSIGEDIAYKAGPMISKACFEEFLAPYYRKITPVIRRHGAIPMVDSDGNVHALLPWLEAVGVEGLMPFERRAGNDVAKVRADHPRFNIIGAFDKTVMRDGEAAIRAEFERLLPVMKTGGFIPSVDHQTPPDVSLEQYRVYVRLLREYCEKAGAGYRK